MADSAIRIFHSDFAVLLRWLIKLAIVISALLVVACVIGQVRADRFPSYYDLAMSLFIGPAACAVLGLIFYLGVLAFPVKLLPQGIRCYNQFGLYRTIKWPDVNDVEFMSVCGLIYALIYAPNMRQPLTLPVWLKDMPQFLGLLEARAGKDHLLVRALREAT